MDDNLSITFEEHTSALLSKNDLIQIVGFTNNCLTCANETEFNNILLSFSTFLEFEFVLYCYTKKSYTNELSVHFANLSNPEEWAAEYDRESFLRHDPVRTDMERQMALGAKSSYIYWDNYSWELSPMEQQVIERRKHYGLNYGFSAFANSDRKDFFFLFSFASKKTVIEPMVGNPCKIACPASDGSSKAT